MDWGNTVTILTSFIQLALNNTGAPKPVQLAAYLLIETSIFTFHLFIRGENTLQPHTIYKSTQRTKESA